MSRLLPRFPRDRMHEVYSALAHLLGEEFTNDSGRDIDVTITHDPGRGDIYITRKDRKLGIMFAADCEGVEMFVPPPVNVFRASSLSPSLWLATDAQGYQDFCAMDDFGTLLPMGDTIEDHFHTSIAGAVPHHLETYACH